MTTKKERTSFCLLLGMGRWIMYRNWSVENKVFVCLLICLFIVVYHPHKNFHLHWDITITSERGSNLVLYLALMTIKQWGFFGVPHVTQVFMLLSEGPIIFIATAECLVVELLCPGDRGAYCFFLSVILSETLSLLRTFEQWVLQLW